MSEIINNEKWLPVLGYEGVYEVSDLGRVKSLARHIRSKSGRGNRFRDEYIMNPCVGKRGYVHVSLSIDGKFKSVKLHRMVANAFIPNPHNKPTVNHKNGDKKNNTLKNLEWATQSEQANHSYYQLNNNNLLTDRVKGWAAAKKKVKCETWDVVFDSAADAARAIGINEKQVCKYINGSRNNRYGLTFRYI